VIIPPPAPGLIIRYSYLWLREHEAGRDEGEKDRPCALVLTIAQSDAQPRVTVLPITHTPPANPALAIELPPVTKRRLGLDHERSWIVLDEGNEFAWPGPDLRPVPGSDPATAAYGFMPPGLFKIVLDRFYALARKGQRVPRT
jgi:hypothetical protein